MSVRFCYIFCNHFEIKSKQQITIYREGNIKNPIKGGLLCQIRKNLVQHIN